MISVGSSDGNKTLSVMYGVEGGAMELETELEEGEACFQNINDDDSAIDPDVALSYIDEKLQDVLGHFQKDFEGGVSAENLGAKFGGYGSFLPTYQRSPVGPHTRTPPNPNNQHIEGDHQYSVSQSSASQSARHGAASISAASMAACKGPSMDDKVKQVHKSSTRCGDKFTSNGPQAANNFADPFDQKNLKVRIKVVSDNSSNKKNAEIYSGLGLEDSPSSSFEASPIDSDGDFHKSLDGLDESPTSILEMMTSFPVHESLLLSPLPYDLLFLTKKEKWEDSSHISVHKGRSQKSTLTLDGPDSSKVNRNVLHKKNQKSSEKNSMSLESTNGNDIYNGVGDIARKETEMTNMVCEEFVSNASRISHLSNTQSNVVDFENGASSKSGPKDGSYNIEKEPLDPVLTRDDPRVEKCDMKDGANGKISQDKKANSDEKNSVFPTKADSDFCKGSRILDIGLLKSPNQKTAQKATSRKKDSMKMAPDTEASTSGAKKNSKESQTEKGSQNVEASKGTSKNDSFSTSKSGNGAYGSKRNMEDLKKSNGKAKETYKDFFGELDLENEDEDYMGLKEKPSEDRLKESMFTEKGTMESQSSSKEKFNGKKPQKPSSLVHIEPTTDNGPVSDATVVPVVKEYWVCCDKCEKWRLLPPGVYPGSLPEKWLCSMLDWLPGMNRCSISEEETTKAMASHFPVPAPVVQGFQPVNPNDPQSGVILDDGVKKKHETKDPSYETKKDKPSLSSNSTKKNLSTSFRSRSLNGTNQSPLFNEVEFQDSGHSGSLISEKHRPKHKEKKKLGDDFVNEGDNLQSKIRNQRETGQDYSRDAKKVKIDHNDSKSASKVSAQNPKDQNQVNSFDGTSTGTYERDVAKKRKSCEFEDKQTYVEETSETEHKEKKARVSNSGAEERSLNMKSEQLRSFDVVDSSKKDMAPVQASMAATSSSSKVSGSHKTKPNDQDAKGSPVESVSSSPLRISNLDRLTSSRRDIEGTSAQGHNEECKNDNQSHANVSHPMKRSKDKNRSSRSDISKVNLKIVEPMKENVDIPPYEKGRRNKSQEKPLVYSDKLEKGNASKNELSEKPLTESAKRDGQLKHGLRERDAGKSSKMEVSGKGKLYSLPPSGKCQNTLSVDDVEKTDALKAPKQNMKAENKNGNQPSNMRNATPNRYKGRDHDAPSPLRRESSNQAATNAVKEAKDLKHLADRLKNSGSNLESTALYFQAALKFLHGASLLESCNGDMSQSTAIYSSTAKLCEFCAHEYEKSKEMAAAALAYKCMEVAYFKVVYLSHTSASKDRHELQASLQIGESPSSSASDLDNLNNPEKAALAKGVNSPQVAGNHFIPAQNKPNFVRLLNYAQDVNFAMEASRRSRIAFAASSFELEEAHHKEGISAVKKALDFNFQDAGGFLHLVRLAMEVISR